MSEHHVNEQPAMELLSYAMAAWTDPTWRAPLEPERQTLHRAICELYYQLDPDVAQAARADLGVPKWDQGSMPAEGLQVADALLHGGAEQVARALGRPVGFVVDFCQRMGLEIGGLAQARIEGHDR